MKSKTNYLEHISLNSEKGIRESLLDNANAKIYYVTSDYEAKYILLNSKEGMRVWIDKSKSTYLIAPMEEIVHIDMVDEGRKEGLDIKFDDFDKNQICIIYVPQEDKDFDVYEDAIVDDYDTEYDYKKGMKVYSRYNDFSQFKLCNLLGEYTKHKIIKEDYVRPTKMYDIKNDTAEFSKEGADWVWWDSETKWHSDYAKAYRVKMSPADYLDLTTSRGFDFLRKGMNLGGSELRDLDIDEFNKETYQPIWLQIEFTNNTPPYTADVVGHEGRHRMFALWQAGVNKVDVQLRVSEENYDKYNPYKVDRVTLKGQFSPYRRVTISGLVPMSWAEHKKIRPNLESMKENINEEVSLDLDYDGRGWILPNGEILSTNNAPHYTKKDKLGNDELNSIRYNFGYERYIQLPKEKPTEAQYQTLIELLDIFFLNQQNVGIRSENIEINYNNSNNEFKTLSISPKDYTSDEVISLIKRIYVSLKEKIFESNNTSPRQEEYFKNSKIRDSKGNLIPVYHGSKEKNIKVFDPRKGKSQFGDYKFGNAVINYFTKDKDTAIGYTEIGKEDDNVYEVYLNIENPYIVNNETASEIKSHSNIKDKKLRDKQVAYFDRIWNKWNNKSISEEDLEELNKDLFYLGFEVKSTLAREEDNSNYGTDEEWYDLYKLDQNTKFGKKHIVEYSYSLEELFDDDMYDTLKSDIIGEEKEDYYFTTDDIVKLVLLMNKEDGTDYDGIIIPDISDIGPTGSLFSNITTDYVTLKSSNQIKSVNNMNPTSSNRIDESNNERVVIDDDNNLLDYYYNYVDNISDKELIEKANIKTSNTIQKEGPQFILPDGTIVSEYNSDHSFDTHLYIINHILMNYFRNIFNGNVDFNYDMDFVVDRVLDSITYERGWVRINPGTPGAESRDYCVLPNKITLAQLQKLLEFLDVCIAKNKKDVLIFATSQNKSHTYSLIENTPDEIIKKIRRFYVSGNFVESINEDIDYNDIYKSMVFENSPKLGPIFINKDGKFYNVGKDKEHSVIFGNEEYESEDYYVLEDNFGLIKANGGNKLEPYPYIDLWVIPNKEQQRAILDWLDLLVVSGRKSVQINSGNFDKEYSFTEYTADEILKDIIRTFNKVQENIDKI